MTGSLVSISWLNLRDTAVTVFFPQKRTSGGTGWINGTVFQVWLEIIAEDCNMDAAPSVLPWDATEAVVDGIEIQRSLPDAMGLEGRTRDATQSRILQGRDPRSICVLIPDGQGPDQNIHDVTIVDMGQLPDPHVTIMQLAELIHRWPLAVINHMTWRQIKRMRSVAKTECKQNNLRLCAFCGANIKTDMYRHVARCHLQLAQLWHCPAVHYVEGHISRFDDPYTGGSQCARETKRASLQKLFPPWTVTQEQYAESLSTQCSGISNDILLFSEVGLTLVHHYRVHSVSRPHAMFRGKYLTQLCSLLLTRTTTPISERPLSNAGPQVAPMSSQTEFSCARRRSPGRRRRSQRQIQSKPTQVAPRLTEQDPWMAAGAVVFDCRPAVLPVSVDVSGMD